MSDDTSTDPRAQAEERLTYLSMLQFRMMRRRHGDRGPKRDPRHGQGRVLALLTMKPEITQRELTYLLGMSRQALAELLTKLERQGFIERTPSETDRRVVQVRLTEAGHRAADAAAAPGNEANTLLDCLSDDEVAQFADYLGRIIDSVHEELSDGEEMRRQMFGEFMRGRADGDPRMGGFRGDPRLGGFPGDPRFGEFGPPGGPDGPGGPGRPGRPGRPGGRGHRGRGHGRGFDERFPDQED